MLKLYNTLTRKKDVFKPIHKGKVGMYSCGPTVYWYQHIGNLRTYVFSDILKRVLKYNRYNVKQVMNVTDVGHLTSDADTGEDKIEKGAREALYLKCTHCGEGFFSGITVPKKNFKNVQLIGNKHQCAHCKKWVAPKDKKEYYYKEKEGKKAQDIANYYLSIFKEDFKKLNISEPDIWCKATEYIKEQIKLIQKLEKKGYTYKTSDGIYFDTSRLKNYGELAKLDVKGLQAGKRVGMGEKKNKTDFGLWHFSEKPGVRQQEWNSPWGVGFPGWHIECSAMSMKHLGETFDIHTGGIDHIPIHHTNEIAQSQAATGKKFVNYWLHGNFLTSRGEKISKSKGGLCTVSELEDKGYSPLDLRYFYLSKIYRQQLNFTLKNLDAAKNSLGRLRNIISELKKSRDKINKKNFEGAKKQFIEIINDDLNTSRALSYLWEILREDKLNDSEKYKLVLEFDKVFGLDLGEEEKIKIPAEIRKLINERDKTRKKKDWKKADELRERIREKGFVVEDAEEGSGVRRI